MSSETRQKSDLEAKRDALFGGALKHARAATLAASLVPVALVTAVPMTVVAQEPCGALGCAVPEPSTLLLLGGGAATALLLRSRRK